jgi:dihydrofolate reductase
MIKALVAVDNNWAIGKDNDLLFRLPNDMRAFKVATTGKIVVCGRKTLESFPGGKPLKNRSTICLCSKENNRDDCYCINDIDKLILLIKELAKTQDIFIIGGAQIYKKLLHVCDAVIVTKVKANGNGTVFFPDLDHDPQFYLDYCSAAIPDGVDNEYITHICTYKRVH